MLGRWLLTTSNNFKASVNYKEKGPRQLPCATPWLSGKIYEKPHLQVLVVNGSQDTTQTTPVHTKPRLHAIEYRVTNRKVSKAAITEVKKN